MTHISPQKYLDTLVLEHCVTLIPCHTLEDFPAFLAEQDAQSLLAAWTAPWHPALVAATGRLPTWHRADSSLDLSPGHLLFLPSPSIAKLPVDFNSLCEMADRCHVIRGNNRSEFLREIATDLALPILLESNEVADEDRIVTAKDFHALGYAWLQIQVMTRRLRYTSNIDEIYFTGRVVEAAKQWIAGDGKATVEALHNAFDALAEERDHYFSTDPHLVDLTLLATSTLDHSLASTLQKVAKSNEPPFNFLIDSDLCPAIANSHSPEISHFKELIDQESVGIAGGGIPHDQPVHHQTAASVRLAIASAKEQLDRTIGNRCQVFARAAGPTPGDLCGNVADLGYIGAIPIDFAAGEGWSSESKLTWNSKSGSLDVLVSKPIDGSLSDPFLTLGVRLGQAIDGGEVATALIVHWPGTESDAYLDLRRAASWGLALGRFWKIDEYFRDGQRPYHHFRGHADDGASSWLSSQVQNDAQDCLTRAAGDYRERVGSESASAVTALANLVRPAMQAVPTSSLGIAELDLNSPRLTPPSKTTQLAAEDFCRRLSGLPTTSTTQESGCLIINPHSSAIRVALRMDRPPEKNEFVFGSSMGVDERYDVTVDLPAHGFVALQTTATQPKKRWFVSRKKIATNQLLVNEFMQVEISPESGGIKGSYSGSGRGNRYSQRLVFVDDDAANDSQDSKMLCRSNRVVRSDESQGVIETEGTIVDSTSRAIADFVLRHSLARGSRWLWVEAEIKLAPALVLGSNPWKTYIAARTAIASDAATLLAPLRDKLHRADGKRFDSPAGLLIDESGKQTLLFNDGRPAYRQRGSRYIDSLLLVRNESSYPLRWAIGFDVPSPIDTLRSLISPPIVVPCNSMQDVPASGWLVHCSNPDVSICDLRVDSTSPLKLTFLAIATRSESLKAKIRFCRDLVASSVVTGATSTSSPQPPADSTASDPSKLINSSGDAIEIALAGHDVVCIRVELNSER